MDEKTRVCAMIDRSYPALFSEFIYDNTVIRSVVDVAAAAAVPAIVDRKCAESRLTEMA